MHTLGFIYAIGAAIAWGLAYTLDQKILASISPLILLFISFVVGALFLLPAVLTQQGAFAPFFVLTKARFALIIFSIALATLANYLIFASIERLGASSASVFEIAYPFFVFLFSFFIFGAQPNGYVFIGSLFIFFGSVIIIRFG